MKCFGHLVMHVRVRIEAPPPQLREQTDQPFHDAHSFLNCSWCWARARRTNEASLEGPHVETQDDCNRDRIKDRHKERTYCVTNL